MSATPLNVGRTSKIEEVLANRKSANDSSFVSRYGGDTGRQHQEREDVRETYFAIDVCLRSGERCGLFYYDLSGAPRLSADQNTLTVPFKELKLVVRGRALIEIYRAILHHSLDLLEESQHPEMEKGGVIESIEIAEKGDEM